MKVSVSQNELAGVDAELVAVGLCEGEELPAELASARGAADAKGGFKKLATIHPEQPARVLVAGLGKREDLDVERLRVVAALVAKEATKLGARSLAWELPLEEEGEELFEGIVTGTILGSYRFDRFKSTDPDDPEAPSLDSLTLLGYVIPADGAEIARVCAEAQNRARDLQSLPSNVATPSYLAHRAEEIAAAHDSLSVEVFGREEIAAKKMGGLVAVSQGGAEDPRLIVLRYDGGDSDETLGLVGKGVTFDTGGISLKPSAGMQ
jgi:leucyl aminopeptidase